MVKAVTVPILDDGHIRLRELTEADLSRVTEQSRDDAAVRWTTIPSPYPDDAASQFLAVTREGWRAGGPTLTFAIESERAFAGLLDLRPRVSGSRWMVGYLVHPSARGRGVASAALRLASAWAFEQGANPLALYIVRGNWASLRVAWSCGFGSRVTLQGWLPGRDDELPQDVWALTLTPGSEFRPAHPWIVPPDIALDGDDGGGLVLRQWRDDDRVTETPDHPAHFMPEGAAPTPESFSRWLLRRREYIASGSAADWCIADTQGRPLGDVNVFTNGGAIEDVAELGYQLFPSARGRGVMRAVAPAVVEYATRPVADGGLGLRRLTAQTAADNIPSNRVLERAGFTLFGREQAVDPLPDGDWADLLHWERLTPPH